MTTTWDKLFPNLEVKKDDKGSHGGHLGSLGTLHAFAGKKPDFHEDQHPRDSKGRFLEIGSSVRLPGGAGGKVTAYAGNGQVVVRRDDSGGEFRFATNALVVLKRPDGGKPTDKIADAPKPMTAQAHDHVPMGLDPGAMHDVATGAPAAAPSAVGWDQHRSPLHPGDTVTVSDRQGGQGRVVRADHTGGIVIAGQDGTERTVRPTQVTAADVRTGAPAGGGHGTWAGPNDRGQHTLTSEHGTATVTPMGQEHGVTLSRPGERDIHQPAANLDDAKAEGERMQAYLHSEHPDSTSFKTAAELADYNKAGAPHALRRSSQTVLDDLAKDDTVKLVPGSNGQLATRGKGAKGALFHTRSSMTLPVDAPGGRKGIDEAAKRILDKTKGKVDWGKSGEEITGGGHAKAFIDAHNEVSADLHHEAGNHNHPNVVADNRARIGRGEAPRLPESNADRKIKNGRSSAMGKPTQAGHLQPGDILRSHGEGEHKADIGGKRVLAVDAPYKASHVNVHYTDGTEQRMHAASKVDVAPHNAAEQGGHVLDTPTTPTIASNLKAGDVIEQLQPGGDRAHFQVTKPYDKNDGSVHWQAYGDDNAAEQRVPARSSSQFRRVDDPSKLPAGTAGGNGPAPTPGGDFPRPARDEIDPASAATLEQAAASAPTFDKPGSWVTHDDQGNVTFTANNTADLNPDTPGSVGAAILDAVRAKHPDTLAGGPSVANVRAYLRAVAQPDPEGGGGQQSSRKHVAVDQLLAGLKSAGLSDDDNAVKVARGYHAGLDPATVQDREDRLLGLAPGDTWADTSMGKFIAEGQRRGITDTADFPEAYQGAVAKYRAQHAGGQLGGGDTGPAKPAGMAPPTDLPVQIHPGITEKMLQQAAIDLGADRVRQITGGNGVGGATAEQAGQMLDEANAARRRRTRPEISDQGVELNVPGGYNVGSHVEVQDKGRGEQPWHEGYVVHARQEGDGRHVITVRKADGSISVQEINDGKANNKIRHVGGDAPAPGGDTPAGGTATDTRWSADPLPTSEAGGESQWFTDSDDSGHAQRTDEDGPRRLTLTVDPEGGQYTPAGDGVAWTVTDDATGRTQNGRSTDRQTARQAADGAAAAMQGRDGGGSAGGGSPTLEEQAQKMRDEHGFSDDWKLGGPASSTMTTQASNLKPGNVIYTHTDGETVNLPNARNVSSEYARTPRTVDHVEKVDGGIVVHFTDGTSTTTPEQAQRFGKVESGRASVYGVATDQRGVPGGTDGGAGPVPDPTVIPESFDHVDHLASHLAASLGLGADNVPRLARIFGPKVSPDFRAIAAVERRLPDQESRDRFDRLQATLGSTLRAKDGELDGKRAADAVRRLNDGDPSLPILSVGQHTTIRVLADGPQPLIPTADRPLVYREVSGVVESAEASSGSVRLVIIPDRAESTPRLTETVPGDARLTLLPGADGVTPPPVDPEIIAPKPPLPQRPPTISGEKSAHELVKGDRILVDGSPVTVTDNKLVDGQRVVSYTGEDGVEWDYEVSDGDTFSMIGAGGTPLPPMPDEVTLPPSPEGGNDVAAATRRAGDLQPGDRFRTHQGIVTVLKVQDDGHPDHVTLTTTVNGVKDTGPIGREALIDRIDPGDLPEPNAHPEGTTSARPTLYTYQRRKLVALGIDEHGNSTLAQAAQRVRTRQALSADESIALASHLRDLAKTDSRPAQQRSYERLAAAFDAAGMQALGHSAPVPTFDHAAKPEKGTLRDITEGDHIAFTNLRGVTAGGKVTAIRSKMSGRLYEVEVTNPDGSTQTHLLNRDTTTYRLPDLPAPVVIGNPPPARQQPIREHVTGADLNEGDLVTISGRGAPNGMTGRVVSSNMYGAGGWSGWIKPEDGGSSELVDVAAAKDGGGNIIRHARGDASMSQPWTSVLPDENPTKVKGGDLNVGDRVNIPAVGRRGSPPISGEVIDISPIAVDTGNGTEGVGRRVEIRQDHGGITAHILGNDDTITRTAAADAAVSARIVATRAAAARANNVLAAKQAIDDHVALQMSALVGNLRMAQGNGRDYIVQTGMVDRWKPLANGVSAGRSVLRALSGGKAGGFGGSGDDPNIAPLEKVLADNVEAHKQALKQSLIDAVPLDGEADHEMVSRILKQWGEKPPAVKDSGKIAESLVAGHEAVTAASGTGGPAQIATVPTLPKGADLATRMKAYRAALPADTKSVGTVANRVATYGNLDINKLEAGHTPDIVMTTTGAMDQAADGGPGEHAMAHHAVIMAAGKDMHDAVVARTAEIMAKNSGGIDPAKVAADIASSRLARDDAAFAVRSWQSVQQARVALDHGFKDWTELSNARYYGSAPSDRARATLAMDDYNKRLESPEHTALKEASRAASDKAHEMNVQERTLKRVQGDARRQAAREIIGQVRDVGGHKITYLSSGKNGGRPLTEKSKLVQAMRFAESNYPTEWLKKADGHGGKSYTLKSVNRGYHEALGKTIALSTSEEQVTGAGGSGRVATHELGHGMEQAIPGLVAAERAFLWSRTSTGEMGSRKRLPKTRLYGKESGYKDDFPEHYTGKDYGTPGTNREAYEVFTTGVESVFAGSPYLDDSLHQFILGTMAVL